MIRKPLSISLEKLRRAQRSLVRRKRGSRVRVSFSHQQPVAYTERQQRPGEKAHTSRRRPRPDPPRIRRQYNKANDEARFPVSHVPVPWGEDHRTVQHVPQSRRAPRKVTPYPPLRQDDGCCDDSFDEAKEHRYWGNLPQRNMSAPLKAKPSAQPPSGTSAGQTRPAVGYTTPHAKDGQQCRASGHVGRRERTAMRPPRDKRRQKQPTVQKPLACRKEREPTPNSKRCGIADPEV